MKKITLEEARTTQSRGDDINIRSIPTGGPYRAFDGGCDMVCNRTPWTELQDEVAADFLGVPYDEGLWGKLPDKIQRTARAWRDLGKQAERKAQGDVWR